MEFSVLLYAVGGVAHSVAQPLKHLIRKNMRPVICPTCMDA